MEPPCLGEELRNLLLWLTSACLSKDLDRKWMDWQVGQEASLKTLKNGHRFNEKWAWPKFCMHLHYNRTPLQEILHPPLQNAISISSGCTCKNKANIVHDHAQLHSHHICMMCWGLKWFSGNHSDKFDGHWWWPAERLILYPNYYYG